MNSRRVVLGLLVAVLLVLAGLAGATVYEDRQQCPQGPWAEPIDRLTGQTETKTVYCGSYTPLDDE